MNRNALRGLTYDAQISAVCDLLEQVEKRLSDIESHLAQSLEAMPNVSCVCTHEPEYTGVPHRFDCPIYMLVRS